MKSIHFYKYHGTGNDFVLIDNRNHHFDGADSSLVERMCHRRFGVGADGLMLLEPSKDQAFTMRYFNSDGKEASMCGNGGRCIAAFAVHLGVVPTNRLFAFEAVDGYHEARVEVNQVALKMSDVKGVQDLGDGYFLNTGSPHYVRLVSDPSKVDVAAEGRKWRHDGRFAPDGTNVNFVHIPEGERVPMRTFERGVEAETWSCGTGAVASAIALSYKYGQANQFKMQVPGGELAVRFDRDEDASFSNIWLTGPAKLVFEGSFLLD